MQWAKDSISIIWLNSAKDFVGSIICWCICCCCCFLVFNLLFTSFTNGCNIRNIAPRIPMLFIWFDYLVVEGRKFGFGVEILFCLWIRVCVDEEGSGWLVVEVGGSSSFVCWCFFLCVWIEAILVCSVMRFESITFLDIVWFGFVFGLRLFFCLFLRGGRNINI